MEEFKDVGTLVESTGVVSVRCQADSADASGGIVEGNGPIASCENKFEFIAQCTGASYVPSIVNMHVESQ